MKRKMTSDERRIRDLARLTLRLEDMLAEALPVVEQVGKKRLAHKIRHMIREKLEWDARELERQNAL